MAVQLGLETEVVDRTAYDHAVKRFVEARIALPTFSQLADPSEAPEAALRHLAGVGPDDPHPANLFRVHWRNGADRTSRVDVPDHVVIPPSLSGVDSPIALAFGNRFPMIRAHKVLAAYACLAPRIVTGQFDPTRHRAIWPSTGNYARGGVAISRIMGCRGVAVLPENMSRERFEWLEHWVAHPDDIIRTPGSDSNVKEIYDTCNELALDPVNVVLNQFCEFGNHLGHYVATGLAMERMFESLQLQRPKMRLAAFVSASGSAGTLGAGDALKDRHGSKIVAVEALECPTMLENGFGEHNIQGIGDKHIPFIHNVMNTDLVVAISDRATDHLGLVFNTAEGRVELERRGVPAGVIDLLPNLGLSSICNLLAAIKTAELLDLGPDDVIVTVATDGAELYASERRKLLAAAYPDGFGASDARAVVARHLDGCGVDHMIECTEADRRRVFNLGYYTWVEQQGASVDDFEARRVQSFWRELHGVLPPWDALIEEFNARTGALAS